MLKVYESRETYLLVILHVLLAVLQFETRQLLTISEGKVVTIPSLRAAIRQRVMPNGTGRVVGWHRDLHLTASPPLTTKGSAQPQQTPFDRSFS